MTRKHSHYFKPVPAGVTHIDVYRVLEMFGVSDPCLQHSIKKLLVLGGRGPKDQGKDLQEAIDTLNRRMEMWNEESSCGKQSVEQPPLCDCTVICAPEPGTRCSSKLSVLKDVIDVWIEWGGGLCPLKSGTLVDVQHRNGARYTSQAGYDGFAESWRHFGAPSDIVSYRVLPSGG